MRCFSHSDGGADRPLLRHPGGADYPLCRHSGGSPSPRARHLAGSTSPLPRHPGRSEAESRDRRTTALSVPSRSRLGLTAVRDDDGCGWAQTAATYSAIMPGLVPGIHEQPFRVAKTWMAGTSPAMTTDRFEVGPHAATSSGVRSRIRSAVRAQVSTTPSAVMPGLVPGIHEQPSRVAGAWVAGTSPAMTTDRLEVTRR